MECTQIGHHDWTRLRHHRRQNCFLFLVTIGAVLNATPTASAFGYGFGFEPLQSLVSSSRTIFPSSRSACSPLHLAKHTGDDDGLHKGFGAANENNHIPKATKSATTKQSTSKPKNSSGDFELQELRAQLDAMAKQNVQMENITPMKRMELESYVQTVVETKTSPIALTDMASKPNIDKLVGTWRLGFSTEEVTVNSLPAGATVMVKIKELPDLATGKNEGELDYILKFRQGALKELTAKSTFTLDPGPIQPGLLTYSYQEVTSGLFGMTIPVGLFGMLKGRVNYIETTYFDGTFWIERGFSPEGKAYYNVYFREQSERA